MLQLGALTGPPWKQTVYYEYEMKNLPFRDPVLKPTFYGANLRAKMKIWSTEGKYTSRRLGLIGGRDQYLWSTMI